MPLKQVPISGIKPFEFISCPVCGANEFTELVPAGGVTCDRCGAKFSVRHTGGDAGCVVDCDLEDIYAGWRWALIGAGYFVLIDRYPFDGFEPNVYLYWVMKSPMDDGTSGEGSGWILTSRNLQPERMLWADKATRRPVWEYRHAPLVTEAESKAAEDEKRQRDEIERKRFRTFK